MLVFKMLLETVLWQYEKQAAVENLRFRNVKAIIKQMLKSREKPRRAPIQIQYQYSSVYMLLTLRRASPTVRPGILLSLFGWKVDK